MVNAFPLLRNFRIIVMVLVAFAAVPVVSSAAELKFANIFSDHMVLQREKPVPVWGWSEPGETVSVAFASQMHRAKVGEDGKWSVVLSELTADAKPQALVVTQSDGTKLEVKDVLVGEVWLGSGQSNMAMTVERSMNYSQEKAVADFPALRHFRESSNAAETAQDDSNGTWEVCTPETVGRFSAALYFCGREIHRELGVPVGLINSSVGGTPIESWIDGEVQLIDAKLKAATESAIQTDKAIDEDTEKAKHAAALKRWQAEVRSAKQAGTAIPARPRSALDDRKRKGRPGGLFNGMAPPIKNVSLVLLGNRLA